MSSARQNLMLLGIGAAVVTLIGAVMPWGAVGPFARSGASGDGMFALLIAVLAAICFVTWARGTAGSWVMWVTCGGGLLAAGIALNVAAKLSSLAAAAKSDLFRVEVGSGVYLTVLGGVAIAGVSLLAAIHRVGMAADDLGRTKVCPACHATIPLIDDVCIQCQAAQPA